MIIMKWTLPCLLFCAPVFAQDVPKIPSKEVIIKQLTEKYQDQKSYIVEYKLTNEKGNTFNALLASDIASKAFYIGFPKKEADATPRPVDAAWSLDGEHAYFIKGKSLIKITGLEQMKIRRSQLLDILQLADTQKEALLTPQLFMSNINVHFYLGYDSRPPTWPDKVTKITSLNKKSVTWDTDDHGFHLGGSKIRAHDSSDDQNRSRYKKNPTGGLQVQSWSQGNHPVVFKTSVEGRTTRGYHPNSFNAAQRSHYCPKTR